MYTSGDVYVYPVGPVEDLHKDPHSAIPQAGFTRPHQEQALIEPDTCLIGVVPSFLSACSHVRT